MLIYIFFIFFSFANAQTGNFIHLTDIHYDQFYKAGSPTNCLFGSTGMDCCRKGSIPLNPPGSASKWGEENCDTPLLLLNHTIDWIRNYLEFDFVVYTGDSASHWDTHQNWTVNYESIFLVTKELQLLGKPIYSVLGNHDSFFVDQLYWVQPVVEDVGELWENNNMTNQANITNFQKGGFYETEFQNVRICGLNSLWYDTHNLAEIATHGTVDLSCQYAWAKEHVDNCFLIAHIFPTAGEASQEFNEFMKTVYPSQELYGHSHQDQFVIINGTELRVAFVAPSVVPSGHFPGIRQFQYSITESNKMEIIDYKQYWLNFTKQKEENNFIGYELGYQAKELYDLVDMSANSWWNLALRMVKNDTLFQKYCENYNYPNKKCNKQSLLCDINDSLCSF
jgi:hypothetical protein